MSGSDEVAVGMAHPELPHVPGIVSKRAHDVCLDRLSLSIHGVYIIDEEDNLNAAATLS